MAAGSIPVVIDRCLWGVPVCVLADPSLHSGFLVCYVVFMTNRCDRNRIKPLRASLKETIYLGEEAESSLEFKVSGFAS